MNKFLEKYNRSSDNKIVLEMKDYANENNVPIVTEEGLNFIIQLIKIKKAKKILEIGTAIGFCAINMALVGEDILITTIERNPLMYEEAKKNVQRASLEDRINIIFKDAMEVTFDELYLDYDIIFIDAAKAQYIKFFEKFKEFLKFDGMIISDNLLFHGLVSNKEEIKGKDLRALVRKIDNYNEWLSNNQEFETVFYNIGDGMAISIRK